MCNQVNAILTKFGPRLAVLLLLVQPVHAVDGVIEIHQACAQIGGFGCFTGDADGFPVEINASGSYVLTSNLTLQNPVTGIVVGAPDEEGQ